MHSLALLAISSFLLAFVLTPLCRRLFEQWGWVDRPDRHRKLHGHPVPRVGGLPIVAAYLGAFAVLMASPFAGSVIVKAALPLARKVVSATALVFLIGLLDDRQELKPWQKLAAELTAAYIAFWAGIGITSVGGIAVPAWLSLPLTVVWLVGCTNAFNLIDGLDGLAPGAGLFAAITILIGGLLHGNLVLAIMIVPLAGALLGFLRYNFNPASIFLGDSGSLTIGFLLGCYAVVWSEKSTTILGMTAPVIAFAVPLLDTAIAMARRFLRQQSIFMADASHIHHRLLARGLTPRRVVLILYGACGLAATMSLLASARDNQFAGVIIVLFCGTVWIGVQHLGYTEFLVATRMFASGSFRRHLNGQIALQALQEALGNAEDPREHWAVVCDACRRFGFTRIELQVNGSSRSEIFVDTNGAACWSLEIPLADTSALCLRHEFEGTPNPTVLMPFAEILHKSFRGASVCANTPTANEVMPTPVRLPQHTDVRPHARPNPA